MSNLATPNSCHVRSISLAFFSFRFNALVFGMLDENDMVYPHGQCCREAVAELNMMKDAALAWVAGVRSEEGSLGLANRSNVFVCSF